MGHGVYRNSRFRFDANLPAIRRFLTRIFALDWTSDTPVKRFKKGCIASVVPYFPVLQRANPPTEWTGHEQFIRCNVNASKGTYGNLPP